MSTPAPSLTARSVLLSVLLGNEPPQLPVQLLVRTTELFGIAEGTTRTALSRMAAAGEVESADGAYRITGADLLARQARQQSSRAGTTRPWNGRWLHAVVAADSGRSAADRALLRGTMASARFSELREGVWLRPDNLGHSTVVANIPELVWFHSTPVDTDLVLAARLWDLGGWTAAANRLIGNMRHLIDDLEAGSLAPLADGFVLSAAVLRHFQADPLLPGELLTATWPGDELRSTYTRYDAAYRSVLADWFRTQQH